jgi:RNA polymerase sigma-70 factor (ECF subfamily)
VATTVPVELVMRAMNERDALEELITQYSGFVLALARARTLDAASADDIAQDVWVIVERELPKLREPKAFLGWLGRVTENAATAYLKKGSRETGARRGLSERQGAVTAPPAESSALMDERHHAVLAAIRSLPEDYRIPVVMRFYQGMTAREIGEVLDAPLGTILSRLFRANAMLKEKLRRHIEEP